MYRRKRSSRLLPLVAAIGAFLLIYYEYINANTVISNPLGIINIVENSLVSPIVGAVFYFFGLIGLAMLVAAMVYLIMYRRGKNRY